LKTKNQENVTDKTRKTNGASQEVGMSTFFHPTGTVNLTD
jgi:hypothetical protein